MRSARLIVVALLAVGCTSIAPPASNVPAPSTAPAPGSSESIPTLAPPSATTTAAATLTTAPATPKPTTAGEAPAAFTPPPTQQDVSVTSSGFTYTSDGVNYAVILHNPNPDTYAATDIELQVTLKDASGPIDTEQDLVNWLGPGQDTAVVGVTNQPSSHPTDIEVNIGSVDWLGIDYSPGSFEFDNVKTTSSGFGETTTGKMTAHFQTQQTDFQVLAVYQDGSGKILGGDFTYINFADPSQTLGFEVDGFTNIKGIASTDMYWQF